MCPICKSTFNQRSNLKSHLLTHNDIKPKQLLEMAERMEVAGRRPTCATKVAAASPVLHRLEDEEEEDIADIDVCSDEDQPLTNEGGRLAALPATYRESCDRWERELARSGRGTVQRGEELLRAEEMLLMQGGGGQESELHTKAACRPFGFTIAELIRK